MAALNWVQIRGQSENIPQFVDLLFEALEKIAPDERAKTLRDTLDAISDILGDEVDREYKILLQRGAEPREALKLALSVCFRSRRKFLFRWLTAAILPVRVQNFTDVIMAGKTPAEQDNGFKTAVESLVPEVFESYPEADALYRLKETGFSQDFIKWAMEHKQRPRQTILEAYQNRLRSGQDRKKAVKLEIEQTLKDYILERIKGYPVAQGPDFCVTVALAIVGLAVSLAVTAVSTGVSSYYAGKGKAAQERLRFDSETAIRRAEGVAKTVGQQAPLSQEEINQVIMATINQEDPANRTWEVAYQAMLDSIRVNRFGRTQPQNEETILLRQGWTAQTLTTASNTLRSAIATQLALKQGQDKAKASEQRSATLGTATVVGVGILGLTAYRLLLA